MAKHTILAFLLALGSLACEPKTELVPSEPRPVPAAEQAAVPTVAAAVASPKEHQDEKICGANGAKAAGHAAADGDKPVVESGCGGASGKLQNPEPQVRKAPSGAEVVHFGDAFGVEKDIAVADLLANPAAWKGKMVRIRGDISAMCHHKRGWFAIAAGDKSGRSVRVVTQPIFLVPHGAIGKTAVAEGVVDLIEVAPEFAAHLKKGHNVGETPEPGKPIIHVLLRARGAEFT